MTLPDVKTEQNTPAALLMPFDTATWIGICLFLLLVPFLKITFMKLQPMFQTSATQAAASISWLGSAILDSISPAKEKAGEGFETVEIWRNVSNKLISALYYLALLRFSIHCMEFLN